MDIFKSKNGVSVSEVLALFNWSSAVYIWSIIWSKWTLSISTKSSTYLEVELSLNNVSLVFPWERLHENSLITKTKQICNKRSTLISLRNTCTYNLSINFSSKPRKNIIQKVNKGFTNIFGKSILYNFCTHQKWKSTFFVTSQIKCVLSRTCSLN